MSSPQERTRQRQTAAGERDDHAGPQSAFQYLLALRKPLSALSQAVNKASTSTTVAASPSPAAVGQTVTFSATVQNTAGTGVTPTGTVTFKEVLNGVTTTLGTRSLVNGVAVLTTSTLPAGDYTIEAFYNVSTDFLASSGNVF
jgi:hypothetical protein